MRIILILVLLSVTILAALGIISLGLHALSEIMSTLKGMARARGKRTSFPPNEDGDVGTIVLPRVAKTIRQKAAAGNEAGSIEAATLAMSRDMALIATDRAGMVTLFNAGAEELLGYSSDSIRGRSFTDLFVPGEVTVLAQILAATEGISIEGFECLVSRCLTGVVEEQEWTWVKSDSTPFSIMLTATALREETALREGTTPCEEGKTAKGFLFVARRSSEVRSLVHTPTALTVPHLQPPAPLPGLSPVVVDCLPVS